MAARKLQTEIDRTLKKVSEGVEQFDSIYEKMQSANNQTQKEKQEVDLKSQIKKLQRMRDQIKTWCAGSEIKDKKQLLDSRKTIETQMERFKACEKEMKTKAFSKEGLNAATKLDPREQAKLDCQNWLSSTVDELSRQIEAAEAEIESLQGTAKKKGAKGSGERDRMEELEGLNERRKWHVAKLELVMRCLENGNIGVDDITRLKEDIMYFVESNTEEDFEEDEGIYDELNLEEEEDHYGMNLEGEIQSSHDSVSVPDTLDNFTPSRPPPKSNGKGSMSADKDDEPLPTTTTATTTTKPKSRQPTGTGISTTATPATPGASSGTATGTGTTPSSNSAGGTSTASARRPTQDSTSTRPSVPLPPPPIKGSTGPAPSSKPPPAQPIRYAAAAAAAVSSQTAPGVTSPAGQPTSSAQPTPAQGTTILGSAPPTGGITSPTPAPSQPPALSSSPASGQSSSQQQTAPSPSPTPAMTSASAPSIPATPATTAPSLPATQEDSSGKSTKESINDRESTTADSPVSSPVMTKAETPNRDRDNRTSTSSRPSSTPGSAVMSPENAPAVPPLPSSLTNGTPAPGTSSSAPSAPAPAPPASGVVIQPPQPQQPQRQSTPPSQQVVPSNPTTPANAALTLPTGRILDGPADPIQDSPSGQSHNASRLPNSLSDLVNSYEDAKASAAQRQGDLGSIRPLLEAGFSNVPQPVDSEKPKYYVPKNYYPTAHSYPQQPAAHLANPAFFSKFDNETLFYIFYYNQGTYLQYLAAEELKKQSWRFHKQYLTWFQRASEPQMITDTFEQGTYLYFDWEGSWCQRQKSDFRFEYKWLET